MAGVLGFVSVISSYIFTCLVSAYFSKAFAASCLEGSVNIRSAVFEDSYIVSSSFALAARERVHSRTKY